MISPFNEASLRTLRQADWCILDNKSACQYSVLSAVAVAVAVAVVAVAVVEAAAAAAAAAAAVIVIVAAAAVIVAVAAAAVSFFAYTQIIIDHRALTLSLLSS